MQLKIKKEFKELIPDLSAEEFKQLEDNCINDGIRDKLIIWEDYIIDGHNRFEIAGKHNLKFQTEEIAFDNEDEAKIFIINLQLGRRNLVEFVKIELMQKRKEILLKVGREKISDVQTKRHSGVSLSIIDKDTKHNTREKLSKELKISSGKLAQAEIVIKKATPEVKQKLRAGEISINNAYQDIKKNEKREEVYKKEISYKENIKEVTEFDVDIFTTDKKFNIVYADPCSQPVSRTEITKTTQERTYEGDIRATFIIKENKLELLKALAYWERRKIKDLLDESLNSFLQAKDPELLKKAIEEFNKTKK